MELFQSPICVRSQIHVITSTSTPTSSLIFFFRATILPDLQTLSRPQIAMENDPQVQQVPINRSSCCARGCPRGILCHACIRRRSRNTPLWVQRPLKKKGWRPFWVVLLCLYGLLWLPVGDRRKLQSRGGYSASGAAGLCEHFRSWDENLNLKSWATLRRELITLDPHCWVCASLFLPGSLLFRPSLQVYRRPGVVALGLTDPRWGPQVQAMDSVLLSECRYLNGKRESTVWVVEWNSRGRGQRLQKR